MSLDRKAPRIRVTSANHGQVVLGWVGGRVMASFVRLMTRANANCLHREIPDEHGSSKSFVMSSARRLRCCM